MTSSSTSISTSNSTNISSTSSNSPIIISSESSSNHEEEQPRRSDRKNEGVPPDRYGNQNVSPKYLDYGDKEKDDKINVIVEPKTFAEVLQDKNKNEWLEAMQDDINSMNINETWELVPRQIDKNIIGCKWVFKIKMNEKNEIERYKARLVAQAFSQKYGVDYDEIFAPVVNKTTFRIFLSIASKFKQKVQQFDVKNVFFKRIHQRRNIYEAATKFRRKEERRLCMQNYT